MGLQRSEEPHLGWLIRSFPLLIRHPFFPTASLRAHDQTMEALASAGTVLTIIHLSAKVTRLGCEYIKGVKGAQGEILALMHELSALSTILLQLHKWITANPGLSELEELIKPDGLLSGCLERLGSQLKELDPKSGHKNWFKRAAIRFVWPLTEMETSQYVTRLETQKSSLLLALAQSHT